MTGFPLPRTVAALEALRRLPWGEGDPLQVRLVGLGRPADFRCPLFGPARVWVSATPFIATRHAKRRGRRKDPPDCHGRAGRAAFATRVLTEEIDRWLGRQLPLADAEPLAYTARESPGRSGSFRPLQFRRARRKAGDDGASRPTATFRVEFAQPVTGPLSLGHAAHFGLGLLVAAE